MEQPPTGGDPLVEFVCETCRQPMFVVGFAEKGDPAASWGTVAHSLPMTVEVPPGGLRFACSTCQQPEGETLG